MLILIYVNLTVPLAVGLCGVLAGVHSFCGCNFKQTCFSELICRRYPLLTPSKGQGLNHHKWRARKCVSVCVGASSCSDNMTVFFPGALVKGKHSSLGTFNAKSRLICIMWHLREMEGEKNPLLIIMLTNINAAAIRGLCRFCTLGLGAQMDPAVYMCFWKSRSVPDLR